MMDHSQLEAGADVEVLQGERMWHRAKVVDLSFDADGCAWVQTTFEKGSTQAPDRWMRLSAGRVRLPGGGDPWALRPRPERRSAEPAAPRATAPERQRRDDSSGRSSAPPIDDAERAELLRRGKALAKNERRRLAPSPNLPDLNRIVRQPLYSPSKTPPRVGAGGSRMGRLAATGGRGKRSMRQLNQMHSKKQLASKDYSKAKRTIRATTAAVRATTAPQPTSSAAAPAPAVESGGGAALEVPAPAEEELLRVGSWDVTAPRLDAPDDAGYEGSTSMLPVPFFAAGGALHTSFLGHQDADSGEWFGPPMADAPAGRRQMAETARAVSPEAPPPNAAKQRANIKALRSARRVCAEARELMMPSDAPPESAADGEGAEGDDASVEEGGEGQGRRGMVAGRGEDKRGLHLAEEVARSIRHEHNPWESMRAERPASREQLLVHSPERPAQAYSPERQRPEAGQADGEAEEGEGEGRQRGWADPWADPSLSWPLAQPTRGPPSAQRPATPDKPLDPADARLLANSLSWGRAFEEKESVLVAAAGERPKQALAMLEKAVSAVMTWV